MFDKVRKKYREPERTCLQMKDNFVCCVFNSLFVPSLQMEVDADDKRHRTRSKGIYTTTHTHTRTHSHSGWPSLPQHKTPYSVHTPLHKSSTVTLELPFLTATLLHRFLFIYLTKTEIHILGSFVQNEISTLGHGILQKPHTLKNLNKWSKSFLCKNQ